MNDLCYNSTMVQRRSKVAKICQICGTPYFPWATSPNSSTCSRACQSKAKIRQVSKTCERCGKPFSVYQARAAARFCSWACRSGIIEKTCDNCGTAYTVKGGHAHKRRTCSRRCAAELRGKEGRGARKGQTKTDAEREAISETLRAHYGGDPSKHWNYKGGIAPTRGQSWQGQRRKARERDGYRCQCCGITEAELGKQLSVHHRRPYRYFTSHLEANALDNLISSCQSCHMKLEHGKITLP